MTGVQTCALPISPTAILEFDREIVCGFTCVCGNTSAVFKSLGKVTEDDALCPDCGESRRPELTHRVDGSEDFLGLTLEQIGLPLWDIVRGREGMHYRYFELSGDKKRVLGNWQTGG